MIKGIKFATVPVTDQDRALEFYTKKLGFRVLTDAPFDGNQRWIELSIPRASPDTTTTPSSPKSCARPRANRQAAALALRAPTMATIGRSNRDRSPRTVRSGGASSISASARG